ncbi:MAG: NCS2 family permease [Candidatus Cloacimonetes bacterium]|nr:NCS2 family permease [Candidatus Cloacimonadota bacterium]
MAYFGLDGTAKGLRTEIYAGITTFLTMSYILLVNPMILSQAGMDSQGVLTATILVSAIASILMGLLANLPFALAPGMGLNAFFTYSLVLGYGVSWQTALGATFVSGVIFLVLTILNVRQTFATAIPLNLRIAIGCGIGLFIALIGLKEAGVVISNSQTLLGFAGINTTVMVFWAGFFVTVWLTMYGNSASLILGILFTTGLGWYMGLNVLPQAVISMPNFDTVFLRLDVVTACKLGMVGPIFTMVMTDMLDSIASFLGMSQNARLIDEDGQPLRIQPALFVDAIATCLSGLFGTSAATVYIESSSGVRAGGKTGLTAIVCGLCFLPFLFFAPLAQAIPRFATAPALLLIGLWMIKDIRDVDFEDFEEAIPAYLAILIIPMTYSITHGIVIGFISHTALKILAGKIGDIHPMMFVMSLLSCFVLLS